MKCKFLTLLIALSTCLYLKAQDEKGIILQVGFNSTGSEFVFWEDNTYGGNVQLIYEVLRFAGDASALGIKASGLFADGMSGGYAGLNLRVDELFFIDFDALIGYSSISNADLLTSYDFGTTEYSDLAGIFGIGIGYRFPSNPLHLRLAYALHMPFANSGLNGGLNLQLGFRF